MSIHGSWCTGPASFRAQTCTERGRQRGGQLISGCDGVPARGQWHSGREVASVGPERMGNVWSTPQQSKEDGNHLSNVSSKRGHRWQCDNDVVALW
jgi:hypothetical protein